MLIEGAIVGGIKTALMGAEVLKVSGICISTGVAAYVSKYCSRPDAIMEERLIGVLLKLTITVLLLVIIGTGLMDILNTVETIFFMF